MKSTGSSATPILDSKIIGRYQGRERLLPRDSGLVTRKRMAGKKRPALIPTQRKGIHIAKIGLGANGISSLLVVKQSSGRCRSGRIQINLLTSRHRFGTVSSAKSRGVSMFLTEAGVNVRARPLFGGECSSFQPCVFPGIT